MRAPIAPRISLPVPVLRIALLAALCLGASPRVARAQGHEHAEHRPIATDVVRVGTVHLPTSCQRPVQADFERAVALLHSFWYAEARTAFQRVAGRDPRCALAHWGVAMTHYHPVWAPPKREELTAGRAAIERAVEIGGRTPLERDLIGALQAFYDPAHDDHPTRAKAFEAAMAQVHARHPRSVEAAAFYGLSLLGTAPPTDKSYANQRKAGRILEPVFARRPDHPGLAHYVIHAYDYPELASQALRAARAYAKIAPKVPHVQHMPSHIFTRLGLWQDSIASNRASRKAAQDYARRMYPDRVDFDELHALDYLAYAHLQQGQDAEARRVLDAALAVQRLEPPSQFAAAYALAAIPGRYALERGRWAEAAEVVPHPVYPWHDAPEYEAQVHAARGLGAARSGDVATARKALGRLETLKSSAIDRGTAYWPEVVEVLRREVAAWLAHAEGRSDVALRLMTEAAELEDASEKHPVTPGPLLPARELLGDLLVELGEPLAAVQAYEQSLQAAPRRFRSVYGAARAAELGGDVDRARAYYRELLALAKAGDGARPEIREAREFEGRVGR